MCADDSCLFAMIIACLPYHACLPWLFTSKTIWFGLWWSVEVCSLSLSICKLQLPPGMWEFTSRYYIVKAIMIMHHINKLIQVQKALVQLNWKRMWYSQVPANLLCILLRTVEINYFKAYKLFQSKGRDSNEKE